MNTETAANPLEDTWDIVLVNGEKHHVDGATFNAVQTAAAGEGEGTGWLVEFCVVDNEGKPTNALLMVNVQHVVTIRPHKPTEVHFTSITVRRPLMPRLV